MGARAGARGRDLGALLAATVLAIGCASAGGGDAAGGGADGDDDASDAPGGGGGGAVDGGVDGVADAAPTIGQSPADAEPTCPWPSVFIHRARSGTSHLYTADSFLISSEPWFV